MKWKIVFAVFVGLLVASLGAWAADAPRDYLPATPEGYEWKFNPALSDEFNGPALDTSKWNADHAFWVGRVPSRFEKNNVSVADGNLLLRSTPQVDDLSQVKNPQKDVWIAAACLASNKPIASYGFYEARIQASNLAMTSSFWFQGPTPYSVDHTSEIDVVEEMGDPVIKPEQRLLMMSNSHFFFNRGASDLGTPSSWKMPTGAAEGYHVYGVWWKDAHTAIFFHDGQQVGQVTFKGDFTEPMSLYFDTEAFTWDGLPTIESLRDEKKNTMRVDWVRSWTLEKK
jgi:hypothetical protein